MTDSHQLCPACGTPAATDAAFCDVCGAALAREPVMAADSRSETAAADSRPEPPAEASHADGEAPLRKAVQAMIAARAAASPASGGAAGRLSVRAVSPTLVLAAPVVPRPVEKGGRAEAAAGALRADPAEAVPFELSWDEARACIEGRAGQLAFRFKALCNLDKVGIAAAIDGRDEQPFRFLGLREGETREGFFDVKPERPGALSVRLRAETFAGGRTHEFFEASRGLEHEVLPATRLEVRGGVGNVTVNYAPTVENNTGIVRQDDARISVSGPDAVRVDHWKDQQSVLGRRGTFRPVAFAPTGIHHENVLIRAGEAASGGAALDELFILPGSDRVSFGKSGSRADACIVPETPDGVEDAMRAGYLSRVHFCVMRDRAREEFELRDGGPADGGQWRESTNGLAVDGKFVGQSRTHALPAGRRLEVVLAPYAVSGGALPLVLETRCWDDPDTADCMDRVGNLSSLLVRRGDNPRKAVLVVWGAAALDPVLGTRTGLRVASLSGRLYLVGASGRPHRFSRFSGRSLPDTPYDIR